jgi:hypothetical protein
VASWPLAQLPIFVFDPEVLKNRGKTPPWLNYMMTGTVNATLLGGRIVCQA